MPACQPPIAGLACVAAAAACACELLCWLAGYAQVAFTYHTWDTFDPDNSCPTCTMSDTLTVINRRARRGGAAL